jgi:uncharacterized protein (UPF0548 family)
VSFPFRHDRVMPVTVMAAGRAQRLREAELTYGEVGQTARRPPSGYHHLRRSAVIGSGTQLFTRAADALLSWQAHLRAGLSVTASSPTAEPGSVVLLGVGPQRLQIKAPCRVVYVTSEPARRGFAYGTLPGHPERGEEAFIIGRHADGTVTFSITAFSRPATALAKAAGWATTSSRAACSPSWPHVPAGRGALVRAI